MTTIFRRRPRTVIFIHDLLMVVLAWVGAHWLRFNLGAIPEPYLSAAFNYLPIVIAVQAVIFRLLGLYRGVWRFASIPDLIRIAKAVGLGVLCIGVTLFLVNRLEGVPRSVLPLYTLLLLLLLCSPRLLYRCWKESLRGDNSGARALVVGAGMAGEMLVRDLLREPDSRFIPIGFVDDDKRKRRSEIHGLRVLGSCRKIPRFVEQYQVDTVLIAIPSASDREMRRVVEICESCRVPFLTLPSLQEVLARGVSGKTLRDVSIEDLLGRDPVNLEWTLMRENLSGRRIVVTGGGGSIGSELCRQLARLPIAHLVIYEKSEYALYQIESRLKQEFPGLSMDAVLGDVADRTAVTHAFGKFRPDLVFHAAAYKHVPLLEDQVREAVKNNVVATQIVAEAAIHAGVSSFVLISTDKAVNPSNVMGACKRAAEMLCQSFSGLSPTKMMTVRFGNVLDSAGSVVPLFREQIRNGGPVTVTHPDMTRYFMTIPEACQLIMEAASVGRGGEIFVLDMGEPVKIGYLAEQMILLSGMQPGSEIEIKYIGPRSGEKMHEELFHPYEQVIETGHDKLMLAESRCLDRDFVQKCLRKLEIGCENMDNVAISEQLGLLVPEYQRFDKPSNLICLSQVKAKVSM